jgi:hypothetical protein
MDLTPVIDGLTAKGTYHPTDWSTGLVMVWDVDHHFLNDKQLVIGHDFVGFTLGRILIRFKGHMMPCVFPRILAGQDSNGVTC